jgi:hypothetical protein
MHEGAAVECPKEGYLTSSSELGSHSPETTQKWPHLAMSPCPITTDYLLHRNYVQSQGRSLGLATDRQVPVHS